MKQKIFILLVIGVVVKFGGAVHVGDRYGIFVFDQSVAQILTNAGHKADCIIFHCMRSADITCAGDLAILIVIVEVENVIVIDGNLLAVDHYGAVAPGVNLFH